MSKNNLTFLIIGIVVLVGLFYTFKPKPAVPSQSTSIPSESTSSANPESNIANAKSFDLIFKAKKLVSGSETLKVMEGDLVTINITNDENEEFHLHGYDKSVDLEANKPSKLEFVANLTGRFPYELENSKTEVGALEVTPK